MTIPACKQTFCATTCVCPIVPDYKTVTGAIATLTNAGTILSQYLQSYGNNPSQFKQNDEYIPVYPPVNPAHKPQAPGLYPADTRFHVRTTLPSIIPIGAASSSIYGDPFSSKLMAKRAAYLSTVQELHKKGELNDQLEPTPGGEPPRPKKAQKVREGRSAASLSRWRIEGDKALGEDMKDVKTGLNARERWEVWKEAMKEQIAPPTAATTTTPKGVGEYAYDTCPAALRIPLDRREAHATMVEWKGGAARRLVLLTASALCQEQLELQIGPVEKEAFVVLRTLGTIRLHKEQYADARAYTERMIRAQVNKAVNLPDEAVSWLVLPIKDGSDPQPDKLRKCIDFDEITACLGEFTTPFSPDLATLREQVKDALHSSVSEMSQRGRVVIRTNLSPSSPFPGKEDLTILQVSSGVSRGKDGPVTPLRNIGHPDQPILEVWPVHSGRSGGAITHASNKPSYVIPEVSHRYCVPLRTYTTLSLIPHIFIALAEDIIAREANHDLFDDAIEPNLMRQAITAPMMYPNLPERHYERLELMGDTIIKLVAVLDTCHGGELTDESHVQRHLRLSNRSLRDNGLAAGVIKYIRYARETTKNWLPAGWTLDGEVIKGDKVAQIGDKVVADVVEAIVGAAYISSQRSLDIGISAMKRLQIPVLNLTSWSDLGKQSAQPSGSGKKILGYAFRDEQNLGDCFNLDPEFRNSQTWLKWKITGDALLDYFVIEYLWDQYPNGTPSQITHMKHSRCGDASLAALVAHLGLHKHLAGEDATMRSAIDTYLRAISKAQKEADQAIEAARAKDMQREQAEGDRPGLEYWSTAPRSHILGDIPELLLAAMLQDCAYDIDQVRAVFRKHFQPFFERYCVGPVSRSNHPKSQFMVHMASVGCGGWQIDRDEGDDRPQGQHTTTLRIHDKVVAVGKGSTPAIATRTACTTALKIVKPEWLKPICTCPGRKF